MSIGLGFVLKLFPIYFSIIAVPFLVAKYRAKLAAVLGKLGIFIAGGITSVGIILVPLIFTSDLSTYVSLLLTGPSLGVNFTGFNMWSIVNLSQLSAVKAYLETQFTLVERVTTIIVGVLILLICYVIFRANEDSVFSRRTLSAVMVSGILITYLSAQTQPQYLLWFLPFLALFALLYKQYRYVYLLISVAATVVYLFAIAGPFFFFEILYVAGGPPSLKALEGNILYWIRISPYFGVPLSIMIFVLEFYVVLSFFLLNVQNVPRKVMLVAN